MRASLFFVVAALAFSAFAQNDVDRFAIDEFTVNIDQAVQITLGGTLTTSSPKVIQGSTSFTAGCGTGLVGCGRDMRIEVSEGPAGRVFTSQIFKSTTFDFAGEWSISNPKNGKSVCYLQYDGNDDKFDKILITGLGGLDFTEKGLSVGVRFYCLSDLPSVFTINIYDTNGVICTGKTSFGVFTGGAGSYTKPQIQKDINFSAFTGSCNLKQVGAAEIQIPSTDAVDATVYQIRVFGKADPSPSRTPTPSLTPSGAASASRTPSGAASQSGTPAPSQSPSGASSQSPSPSNTPTPSPSPSGAPSQSPSGTPSTSKQCSVLCNCPVFTCHLVYDFVKNGNLFYN